MKLKEYFVYKIFVIVIVSISFNFKNESSAQVDQLSAIVSLVDKYDSLKIIDARTSFPLYEAKSYLNRIKYTISKIENEKVRRVYFIKFYISNMEENFNFYRDVNRDLELDLQIEIRNQTNQVINPNNTAKKLEFEYSGSNTKLKILNKNDFLNLISPNNYYCNNTKYSNYPLFGLLDLKYIVIHKTEGDTIPLDIISKASDSNKLNKVLEKYYKLESKFTQFCIEKDGSIHCFAPTNIMTHHTTSVKKNEDLLGKQVVEERENDSVQFRLKDFDTSIVNYNSIGIEHVGFAFRGPNHYAYFTNDESYKYLDGYLSLKMNNSLFRKIKQKYNDFSDFMKKLILRHSYIEIHVDITWKQKRTSWLLVNFLSSKLGIPFRVDTNIVAHETIQDKTFGEGQNITEFYLSMLNYINKIKDLNDRIDILSSEEKLLLDKHQKYFVAILNDYSVDITNKKNWDANSDIYNIRNIIEFYQNFDMKVNEVLQIE
jgi:hypothetical protein